jgi:hypothetical protein
MWTKFKRKAISNQEYYELLFCSLLSSNEDYIKYNNWAKDKLKQELERLQKCDPHSNQTLEEYEDF